MAVPLVRRRARKPKVRTGCQTCRARHLKCGEERPACRRCVISGRQCPGYPTLPAKPNRGSNSPPPVSSQRALAVVRPRIAATDRDLRSSDIIRAPCVFTIALDSRECHMYDLFRLHTIRRLPGNPWTLSWHVLVLQMGPHRLGVAHAAVALGALQRSLDAGSISSPDANATCLSKGEIWNPTSEAREHFLFALDQCNKAMRSVRADIARIADGSKPTTSADVEAVLVVSLLFFCFDILRGQDVQAVIHLGKGAKILLEHVGVDVKTFQQDNPILSSQTHPKLGASNREQLAIRSKRVIPLVIMPRRNMDILTQTFLRLDGDESIVGNRIPSLRRAMVNAPQPSCFANLDEAMVHLDGLALMIEGIDRDILDTVTKHLEKIANGPSLPATDAQALKEVLADSDLRLIFAKTYSRTMDLQQLVDGEPSSVTTELGSSTNSGSDLETRMFDCQRAAVAWMDALATLPTSKDNGRNDQAEPARLLLQIQFFYMWVETSILRKGDPGYVDRYEKEFAHVVAQAESYLELVNSLPYCSLVSSLGTSLIASLCVVITRCRTGTVRRRGLNVLAALDMRGFFDSKFLEAFLLSVVEIEEDRARSSLPSKNINKPVEVIVDDSDDDELKTEQSSPDHKSSSSQDGYRNLECHDIPDAARFIDVDLGGRRDSNELQFYRGDVGKLVGVRMGDGPGEYRVELTEFRVRRRQQRGTTGCDSQSSMESRTEVENISGEEEHALVESTRTIYLRGL